MENNELNNVTEDVVENVASDVIDEVAKKTFAEKHPRIYSIGVLSLCGVGIYGGMLVAHYAVKGIKKGVQKVKDVIATKKEAKKQEVIENSDEE